MSTNGCGPEVSSLVKWPELEKAAEIVKLQKHYLYSLFQPTAFFHGFGLIIQKRKIVACEKGVLYSVVHI